MSRAIRPAALAAVLLLGGCGTLNSLEEPRIYGGTRWVLKECGRTPGCCHCGWLIAPDLPCSVVFDTLLLPFTVIYQLFFSSREPVGEAPHQH